MEEGRRPTGTWTFLFTDIEGSTRRWETDPDAMRAALGVHDEVLRSAIEAAGGWLFKHTGDGVCAAFGSARAAVDAAVRAQRGLALPVRMGLATGEAEPRGDDYFGPALNRAARVMAAGHGGQILVAASTASLLSGVELIDLGEHRLRDLSGAERLHQVRADGLRVEFPAVRTLDALPGNLPIQTTSFVGRDAEVKELAELVRSHRLVTLTGVGGIGKTRLALQVAAEVADEFPDGVWLVELAPLRDSEAVPDAVATTLGVTAQPSLTISTGVAQALAGRQLLIVLDNCEHVLDAAADLIETILARSPTPRIIATSREGLRANAEQLWPVPALDVEGGATSSSVALFLERARAVDPHFTLEDAADVDAVADICRRLDGLALAIELAAARMVSMSPSDVRDRLDDRFRLLAAPRRGEGRHQTLHQAVAWSYDLLDDIERAVLGRCSIFAGGFDLAAATHLCRDTVPDEYEALDRLDSLVRKSLVTVERAGSRARYGVLETIRQFAAEQVAALGVEDELRDRHAAYFADRAIAYWDVWQSPDQRQALDWLDIELANLRAAFRWAAPRDLVVAAAIAAHSAVLGMPLERFEPVGWAEELLSADLTEAEVPQLPRLYCAASLCMFVGRFEEGVGYARRAVELEADPRADPFPEGFSSKWMGTALRHAGRSEDAAELYAELMAQGGPAYVYGSGGLAMILAWLGRDEEARALADDALEAARALGNPFFVGFALYGRGLAFARSDPAEALESLHQGLEYAAEHRQVLVEASMARDAGRLEMAHGDQLRALELYELALGVQQGSGNVANLFPTLTSLAVGLDRMGLEEVAATLHGATAGGRTSFGVPKTTVEHARSVLGDDVFDRCAAQGAAMEPAEAARYARQQIDRARAELAGSNPRRPS